MTKKAKHPLDPDELRAVPSAGGGANIKDGYGNVAIARVYAVRGWEARVKLYLAAPDLLACCRWFEAYAPTPADAARVRAAIRKAEEG